MTTKYLSEHGATVLRVESAPNGPRPCADAGPFAGGQSGVNRSGYFANYNANKFGLSIDMGHPQAPELILRIAAVGRRDYRELHARHAGTLGPGLRPAERRSTPASCSSARPCWDAAAHMQTQPGFGAVLSSLAGYTNIIGWPDRGPTVNPYGAYTDFVCPKFAVAAILAAVDRQLRHRSRHPPGYVPAGNQPPLRRPHAAGRRRQRSRTGIGGKPPSPPHRPMARTPAPPTPTARPTAGLPSPSSPTPSGPPCATKWPMAA